MNSRGVHCVGSDTGHANDAAELDMGVMLEVLNVSSGRNSATGDKFPNHVLTGKYASGFTNSLMAKDVRLFNSIAAEVDTGHTVSEAVGIVWNAFDEAMPGSDFSEIWKFVGGSG